MIVWLAVDCVATLVLIAVMLWHLVGKAAPASTIKWLGKELARWFVAGIVLTVILGLITVVELVYD